MESRSSTALAPVQWLSDEIRGRSSFLIWSAWRSQRRHWKKYTRLLTSLSLFVSLNSRLFKTGTVPWASKWSYEHSNAQRQEVLNADHDRLDTVHIHTVAIYGCHSSSVVLNPVHTQLSYLQEWQRSWKIQVVIKCVLYSVNRTKLSLSLISQVDLSSQSVNESFLWADYI